MTSDTTSQSVTVSQAESFMADAGLAINKLTGSSASGHIELGAARHTHWSIVHGGAYCIVIEATLSLGASAVVEDPGMFTVGHTNHHAIPAFDHFRTRRCRRRGAQSGRTQQLWRVDITDDTGRLIAHTAKSRFKTSTPPAQSPERPRDSSGSAHPARERQQADLTGIDGPAPGAAYRILFADHGHGHHRREIP
jgi:1,4-dihydroxy-2-naphthoyl-CoA hydrolase